MKFDDHLDFLRRVARRAKVDFCDLLRLLVSVYQKKPRPFRMSETKNNVLEENLIEEYRLVFRKLSSSRGGKAAAQNTRDKLKEKNGKVIERAKKLTQQGRGKHELAGIISRMDGRTDRQIRNILKEMKKTEMQ